MEQQTNGAVMEFAVSDSQQPPIHFEQTENALQIARCMLDAGAATISLPSGFVFTNKGHKTDHVIIPSQDAVRNLRAAQSLTHTLSVQPILIASTAARRARILTSDSDQRDRRFLTGMKTMDDRFGYCGGMDAVISRALAYAQYADVVCYTASEFNLAEAERFATEVHAVFPGKQLGFGYFPSLHESLRNGQDRVALEKKLQKIGYQYFFLNQFGSMAFLSFPDSSAWVFFDDRASLADSTDVDEDAWQFSLSRNRAS